MILVEVNTLNVGKRIIQLREDKGISTNKLANLAGISQSYLRDIELGNKQPTVEYLSYICDTLGITLKIFFDDEESQPLERAIAKLSDEQQEKLLDFINSI